MIKVKLYALTLWYNSAFTPNTTVFSTYVKVEDVVALRKTGFGGECGE
eukprot:gene7033-4986_t